MYLHNKEDNTKNMTTQKEENPYQNHILFLLNSTMVLETIMLIFLFSVIFLIITALVFWFISVTWEFCKGKVLIEHEVEEEEVLELDLPPSYSTLDLTPPEFQALEVEKFECLRSTPSPQERERFIKKRLLYERQSRMFRSLD